ERDVRDLFLVAQLGELGLGEHLSRLEGGARIWVAVSDVRDAIAFRPELEQAEQLARTAQGARRIGPRIFDPDASLLEDRMIRPEGKAEFPPSHQVAHIEVETLAHDLEGNPPSLAEGGE